MRKNITLEFMTAPATIFVFIVFALMLFVLILKSSPALERFGYNLFTENIWIAAEEPEEEKYGLLAVIWGSVYTAAIATLVSLFLSISYAIFVVDIIPKKFKNFFIIISDVMAGVPTIIYGIWGAFILVPILRDYVMQPIYSHLHFIPIFDYPPTGGYSYFAAGLLLAIMVTPFSAAMIREAYFMIPFTYKEAATSLALTRYEKVKLFLIYIKPSIVSAMILSFGRAVGETVAVSLVIGNTFSLTTKLFSPGYTISSLIANQFGNAFIYEYMTPVLFAAGLILFIVGLTIEILGKWMLRRWQMNVKI